MKKTSRIQTLAMIMVLCLFIYSMTEFRLRRELERVGETVTSQTKKQTQRPTLKWTFFLFWRVREFVLVADGERVKRITNLNEELRKILGLLGSEYKDTIFEWRPAECEVYHRIFCEGSRGKLLDLQ